MSGPNGLADATWDTASCASIRIGGTKIDLLKFTPSKVEVKKEKSRPIGAMIANKRTPGTAEVSDAQIELLTSTFMTLVLPRWGEHAATELEVVIVATLNHPSVLGSYAIIQDRCSFSVLEGPEFDGSEKPAITKLAVSVMQRYDKGADGKWHALYRMQGRPSSTAQALLKF